MHQSGPPVQSEPQPRADVRATWCRPFRRLGPGAFSTAAVRAPQRDARRGVRPKGITRGHRRTRPGKRRTAAGPPGSGLLDLAPLPAGASLLAELAGLEL